MSEKQGLDQRSGGDRRDPSFQPSQFPGQGSESWHLDKKVPISLILAILFQFGVAILAYGDIKKDVELLKQDTVALHQRDVQQADSLKDAMRLMQEQYRLLDAKLDRLIERGSK